MKNNPEKVSDSQEFCVSLHQENNNIQMYGTDNNKRTETAASTDHAGERYERLGLRACRERGRPSLGNRWDTLVYEEGLQSEQSDDLLGSPRLATLHESERLIQVARQIGDYIPSTVWESYGSRNKKPSGESVVFLDEKNNRVVKFKDPFAYVSLKDDNPYSALYEHHIHNYFFSDAGYRLLGVSQDPVSGGVRFVFEQPYIKSYDFPSKEEISNWFKKRGFQLTPDGFWYTDGNVSFTDVWGDNCIKDTDGNLHFIDPIIKFEREPKEVIKFYIERDKQQVINHSDTLLQITSSARQVIFERIKDPSSHAAFNDKQINVLEKYTSTFPKSISKYVILNNMLDSMVSELHNKGIPDEWINDVREELRDLSIGIRRSVDTVLRL